jgi:hypothetical protein
MGYRRPVLSTNTGSVTVESFNRAGIEFVFTELDVAITFCRQVALRSGHVASRSRYGECAACFSCCSKKAERVYFQRA